MTLGSAYFKQNIINFHDADNNYTWSFWRRVVLFFEQGRLHEYMSLPSQYYMFWYHIHHLSGDICFVFSIDWLLKLLFYADKWYRN